MIDRIVFLTMQLKERLIRLGYALPPVMHMHNNKLKQIDMDLRQMSTELTRKNSGTLYQMASIVFSTLTGEHFIVSTLDELLKNSECVYAYVASY